MKSQNKELFLIFLWVALFSSFAVFATNAPQTLGNKLRQAKTSGDFFRQHPLDGEPLKETQEPDEASHEEKLKYNTLFDDVKTAPAPEFSQQIEDLKESPD